MEEDCFVYFLPSTPYQLESGNHDNNKLSNRKDQISSFLPSNMPGRCSTAESNRKSAGKENGLWILPQYQREKKKYGLGLRGPSFIIGTVMLSKFRKIFLIISFIQQIPLIQILCASCSINKELSICVHGQQINILE